VHKIHNGIGTCEQVMALVRFGNQGHASVVADPALLQLYELRDLRIVGVQLFELLDVAGKHSDLIERTIVRERMLFAPAGPEEDEGTEKKKLVPHESILAGAGVEEAGCVVGDTRAKGQVGKTGRRAGERKVFSAAVILRQSKL
jgi:hypothetical protein